MSQRMTFEVGTILEGKVTGITKFGAFVSLPEGRSGMVHISEIASSYVKEVTDHLSMGQQVRVIVLGEDERGRLSLSIKKAVDQRPKEPPKQSIEYMLSKFMSDSGEKISSMKKNESMRSRRNPGRGK